MSKLARSFALMLTFIFFVTTACSGKDAVPTTSTTAEPTTTTTTAPPVTTTTVPSTTTTSTTTTIPVTTTTTQVIPPANGIYIVDPAEYPKGIPISSDDYGNVPGSEVISVGFLLPMGSEILAPFDGYLDTQANSFIAGRSVPAGLFFQGKDMSGDYLLVVEGNGLTFTESGAKKKGEVIAVVTDPTKIIIGLNGPVNVLVGLSRFNADNGMYEDDIYLMREFFSYLS